jgi:tRNA threonylcarbamoyladenosine biosynthesis protein TsaB
LNWLLALTASSGWCSVAIDSLQPGSPEDRSECWSQFTGHDQSHHMLRMIHELLSRRSIARSALAAIAFEAGPGAFTSLRISCSVGQGLAFGLGVPLVPVGSLEAMAVQAIGLAAPGRYPVVAAIDARMGEIYASSLIVEVTERGSPGSPVMMSPPRAGAGGSLADWSGASRFNGQEVLVVGEIFEQGSELSLSLQRAGVRAIRGPGSSDPLRAESVAAIARARLPERSVWDPADAGPLYVRDKVALDRDEQQRQRLERLAQPRGGC